MERETVFENPDFPNVEVVIVGELDDDAHVIIRGTSQDQLDRLLSFLKKHASLQDLRIEIEAQSGWSARLSGFEISSRRCAYDKD